ncbi:MAG: phosphatase domain-containing protein [Acidimicrobiales bacterium]
MVDETTDRLVISDIDDTILSNGAGNVARTVLQTIAGSHLTRRPIDGAPELYRRLTTIGAPAAPPCPVFYVSSSPWNLFDFLTAFMDHHGFPVGPLLLRDLGLNRSTFGGAHGAHKVSGIAAILDAAPNADVVLIGDTSQQDAMAFSTTIIDHLDRVTAAYLRDVGDESKTNEVRQFIVDEALDDTMLVIDDLAQIADDLAARQWGRSR